MRGGLSAETGRDTARDLQVVFSTGRGDIIALAKSMLQSAGIEFCVEGEYVQDLFGWGRFPGGASLLIGSVRFLVRPQDAADATALLASLSPAPQRSDSSDEAEDPVGSALHDLWRRAPVLAKIGAGVALAFLVLEVLWPVVARVLQR